MGYIYVIRNTANDMCYVGQSEDEDPMKRINDHFHGKGSRLIALVIKAHGVEIFKSAFFSVPDEHLNYHEKETIKEFNSVYPYGYNLTEGGDCSRAKHKDEYYPTTIPVEWEDEDGCTHTGYMSGYSKR